VIESATGQAPDGDPGNVAGPPLTDDAVIDDAMLAVGDLAAAPLPEHHDRLARAHEVLHSALEREDEPIEPA
jgi:hypothetical protein